MFFSLSSMGKKVALHSAEGGERRGNEESEGGENGLFMGRKWACFMVQNVTGPERM